MWAGPNDGIRAFLRVRTVRACLACCLGPRKKVAFARQKRVLTRHQIFPSLTLDFWTLKLQKGTSEVYTI